MEIIDLVIVDKLINERNKVYEEKRIQLEVPRYNIYENYENVIKQDIKEPKRVIVIDI
jgi:hypothetical protein